MKEAPFLPSSLEYDPLPNYPSVDERMIFYLKWEDGSGTHKEKIEEKIAELWRGYAELYILCNDEVIILK